MVSEIFKDPAKGHGFLAWAAIGAGGAMVALLLGTLFPSLIPTRVTSTSI